MSRGWKPTDLVMGEDLVLPDEFFVMPKVARQRMEYCVYAGETETGIIVEVQYKPSIFTTDPLESFRVQKFIDFGAIYSGQVKIYRRDRTLVKAERKNDLIVQPRRGYTWHNKEVQRWDLE